MVLFLLFLALCAFTAESISIDLTQNQMDEIVQNFHYIMHPNCSSTALVCEDGWNDMYEWVCCIPACEIGRLKDGWSRQCVTQSIGVPEVDGSFKMYVRTYIGGWTCSGGECYELINISNKYYCNLPSYFDSECLEYNQIVEQIVKKRIPFYILKE